MVSSIGFKRETVEPPSNEEWLRQRARDITSTESAALFGLSPYTTPFELWHRKKNAQITEIEPNERMKWGTRLQDSIAAGLAEDHKWKIQRRTQYDRLVDERLGASYDFTIIGGDGGDGLLEIKNVDPLMLRDGWVDEGEDLEAPPHIEMQVQHQLLVSGLPYAYIGALVGGNRGVLIRREPAPKIMESILDRAAEFWKSIEDGIAPKPDFSRDSAFIARLYSSVKPGRVVNVEKDAEVRELLELHKKYTAARDAGEKGREEIKAKLFMKLGDAEKAIGDGFSINLGTVKAARVEAFERAAYRSFRVNWKKS